MFYQRSITDALERMAKFPIVGVFGPRQSGKTTLVRNFFTKHTYLNLEDPILRAFAAENPVNFLQQYANPHGLILDEFQYVPQILSYIQIASDAQNQPGYFILTGSQNFLMNQAVTQSLAGRIGILTLLPFSISEMQSNQLLDLNSNQASLNGCYPRIYEQAIAPADFYPSYIQSYLERDVRLLINVENLLTFQKFMQLCAARTGQQLNISDLATNCNISQKTVQSWLSILSASYIIFLLSPYFANFNKRITKSPKLYFYDTGLACALLNLKTSESIMLNPIRGALFETYIIADLAKQFYNAGERPSLYFWRDLNGRIEVDSLVDLNGKLTPIEIKSGESEIANYFKSLTNWQQIAGQTEQTGYVIYGGEHTQKRQTGVLTSWLNCGEIIKKIRNE